MASRPALQTSGVTRGGLFQKHRPLALAIAREWRIDGMGADDIRQEALIMLWEATRTFDPTRGTFAPYARMRIKNRLCDLRDSFTAHDRRLMTVGRDLAVPFGDPDQTKERLGQIVQGLDLLTATERKALADYLNGAPARSSKRHDNALQRARRKLRKIEC